MGWLERRKERKAKLKRIQDSRQLLPGSSERIEKALTLPTSTGKPNPLLDRLDPAKVIHRPLRPGTRAWAERPPSNRPEGDYPKA